MSYYANDRWKCVECSKVSVEKHLRYFISLYGITNIQDKHTYKKKCSKCSKELKLVSSTFPVPNEGVDFYTRGHSETNVKKIAPKVVYLDNSKESYTINNKCTICNVTLSSRCLKIDLNKPGDLLKKLEVANTNFNRGNSYCYNCQKMVPISQKLEYNVAS